MIICFSWWSLIFFNYFFIKIQLTLATKSLQSCPTPCDPMDGSPPGSPVPGILQARTLEAVAISFSNALKWKVKVKLLSHVWLLSTPRTAPYQAPASMGFSRQENWSGLPLLYTYKPCLCTGLRVGCSNHMISFSKSLVNNSLSLFLNKRSVVFVPYGILTDKIILLQKIVPLVI